MDKARFGIFKTVAEAYTFLGREWGYLLRLGLIPMAAHIATALFVYFQREGASQMEDYLWSLPATALFGWFMFLEMRLFLLDERLDKLAPTAEFLAERQRALQASVILYLLFNMGMSAAFVLLITLAGSGDWGRDWALTLGGLFLIGGVFWGLRFCIAPVLAAVHQPLRPVLRRVAGAMFSFRLIGMGLLALFPLAVLFQILLTAFIGGVENVDGVLRLSPKDQVTLVILGAPFSLAVTAVLNAALASALKQILGSRR